MAGNGNYARRCHCEFASKPESFESSRPHFFSITSRWNFDEALVALFRLVAVTAGSIDSAVFAPHVLPPPVLDWLVAA
jgi:hypothetical protein